MRATVMHSAHDVRIENVADAAIQHPTDALIRVTRACICGSDLWPYNGGPNVAGQQMGHEAIGVVIEVGSAVQTIRKAGGDHALRLFRWLLPVLRRGLVYGLQPRRILRWAAMQAGRRPSPAGALCRWHTLSAGCGRRWWVMPSRRCPM
jgi:NADPH:quinone reductase-like Zn-dependent oxidoreductase